MSLFSLEWLRNELNDVTLDHTATNRVLRLLLDWMERHEARIARLESDCVGLMRIGPRQPTGFPSEEEMQQFMAELQQNHSEECKEADGEY